MSQVLAQVYIDAPGYDIWEALVDSEYLPRWLPESLDRRSRLHWSANGSHAVHYNHDLFSSAKERATDWEFPRLYSYVVDDVGPVRSAQNSFSLEACGRGIRVTQAVDFKMKFGPLGAVMDNLLFRRQFRKQMEASLAALKRYAEDRHLADARSKADRAPAA